MIEQDSYVSYSQAKSEAAPLLEDNRTMFRVAVIEILTQLSIHRKLIATVTGSAMLLGLLCAFVLPVRYTSVTKIMPPRQVPSTSALVNGISGVGSLGEVTSGGLSLRDPNAIYIGLLKSRTIADAIINTFNLEKVYRVKDMTAARKRLQANTTIISEQSTLISISVTDSDKKRVADMASAYTEQLRALTKTLSLTEASRRRVFFEEQLKSQKEALLAAEVAFQQTQQRSGLVHLDAQANVLISSLGALRAKIAAKEVELQALRSYSTERNTDVQLAERELAAMQGEAAHLEQNGQPSGSSEMGLKDVPKAGLDYIRAQRELQYQQSLFDLLLKQYEAARLDEAKEAAVIQVVEPAIEPDSRSSPHRALVLLLFTIGGFLASCFLVWVMRLREAAQSDPDLVRALQNLKGTLSTGRG